VTVVWSRPAVCDLVALRRHIGERNLVAAREVARKIVLAIDHLASYPGMGRAGRVAGTRELVVTGTPYLVPYRVKNDRIEILRVLHGARMWPRRF
jgi:toxin ParE1/3/4